LQRLIGFSALALAAGLSFHTRVQAAPPAALSTDVYGRLPNIEMMQLSPSGEKLAYVVVTGDHRQIIIKDIADKPLMIIPLADYKIRNVEWVDEDHLLIFIGVTQQIFTEKNELYKGFVANLATRKTFEIFGDTQTVFHNVYGYQGSAKVGGRLYGYFGGLTLSKSRGFGPTFNYDGFVELYRVDPDTGSAEIAAHVVQYPHQWALAADGTVVAHSEYNRVNGQWTLMTGREGGDVLTTLKEPLDEISLEGLGRTPGTVLIDKAEPEEWNLTDGSHALLPTDRVVAAEPYLYDPISRCLLGAVLIGDAPEQQFFDPVLKARQAAFRKALGGNPLIESWSSDFKRLILYTTGDSDAGTWWIVDGNAVKPYKYSYPEIPDANVGLSRMITYKAGDGLEIHGVLTLPPGRDPKDLPLIVLPHGGPQAHDDVSFDWWAQAFAGRGYAVFQPNFRGSDGYGLAFRDAGFGEWGRKMQTDISDGVAELAHRGFIDPKRACIVGGSYGGYAALAGVTVQHGLYRCAVSYAGISDLQYFMNTVAPADADNRDPTTRYLMKFLGIGSNDDPALRAISPARLASQADAPILLMHGLDDTVVPIGQSQEMERYLKAAGKPVEFVQIPGEDHWLSHDAARKAMLAASMAFVEKYNPAN
jgi:dienelactone hydrolase